MSMMKTWILGGLLTLGLAAQGTAQGEEPQCVT
jgi:hypothetical protein